MTDKRKAFTVAWLGLIMLLTATMLAISTSTIRAGALTVTNTNDSGPGSLRQAIADAQPGDTIGFALTYPATITLTTGQLVISKPLTITGPSPDMLVISGNDANRVFLVDKPSGSQQISVTISGLIIREGRADYGGGLWNDENLTLMNVTFLSNTAEDFGGGMYNLQSSPMLSNVIFVENSANAGGGMGNFQGSPTLTNISFNSNVAYTGGGMNSVSGSPTLTDVTFYGNLAEAYGGGMNSSSGNPILTNVRFVGNSTDWGGGGMHNLHSSPTLTNVIFGGNSANVYGGGMHNENSSPILTNATFNGNMASVGGGIYNDGSSGPIIQNSILWGNGAWSTGEQISGGTPTIAYSNVQGSGGSGIGWDASLGIDGGDNIDTNPLFLTPVNPATAPTIGGDLRLQWGSPSIDTGNNSFIPPGVISDPDGNPRLVNGIVDMGAYEIRPWLYLSKTVNNYWVRPGQHITYTLTAADTFSDTIITKAVISDALPPGLELAGPITLDPPDAGVVGIAPPILVSDLTITPGEIVTISLPVTIQTEVVVGPITNTATITSMQIPTPQLASHMLVVSEAHITVVSDADDGPGSLRQAIAQAAPSETIAFALTYPATITLISELVIAKPLTITGPGPDLLAISGNGLTRVFRIDDPSGEQQIAVALSGLAIQDGSTNFGGGLWNDENLKLTGITFSNNLAIDGGGMYNISSSSILMDVIFRSNKAMSNGGGMYNNQSNATLMNVVFSGNLVQDDHGGGMYNLASSPTLTNVTFNGNVARYGGGIYNSSYSSPTIQNSILWGNHATSIGDQILNDSSSTSDIANSDVQDSGGSGASWDASLGTDGGGNLDAIPLFVEPIDPATAPTMAGDLRLQWGSLAIDAGDNNLIPPGVTTDLLGRPRIYNGIVDMGAYETFPYLYLPIISKIEP